MGRIEAGLIGLGKTSLAADRMFNMLKSALACA